MSVVEQFQAATEALAASAEREALAVYARLLAGELTDHDAALLIAGAVNRANAAAVALSDTWLAVQIEQQAGVPVPTVGVLPVDDSERLVKAVATVLTAPPKTKMNRAEVREAIEQAGLDTADWNITGITKAVNWSIRERLMEMSDEDGVWSTADRAAAYAEHGRYSAIDFLERVAESGDDDSGGRLLDDIEAGVYDDLPPVWDANPADAETRIARLARCEPLKTAQQATHDAMQQQPLVEGWVRQFDADPCQLCVWWWREGRIWPKSHRMPTHTGCNCSQRIVLTDKDIKPVRAKRG